MTKKEDEIIFSEERFEDLLQLRLDIQRMINLNKGSLINETKCIEYIYREIDFIIWEIESENDFISDKWWDETEDSR